MKSSAPTREHYPLTEEEQHDEHVHERAMALCDRRPFECFTMHSRETFFFILGPPSIEGRTMEKHAGVTMNDAAASARIGRAHAVRTIHHQESDRLSLNSVPISRPGSRSGEQSFNFQKQEGGGWLGMRARCTRMSGRLRRLRFPTAKWILAVTLCALIPTVHCQAQTRSGLPAGRLCLHTNCTRRRAYGFPAPLANTTSSAGVSRVGKCSAAAGATWASQLIATVTPQHCAQHKLAGQVNLMTPRCTAGGCTRAASFGPPVPENGANSSQDMQRTVPLMRRRVALLRCAAHRREGDVDLRRCV